MIVVSEEGVARSTAAHAVKLAWEEVSHVRETRRAFLLYDAEHPVFAVEKSAIPSGDEVAAVRRFLQERKPGIYRRDPARSRMKEWRQPCE